MRSDMKRADRNMISDVVDALRRRWWSDDVKTQIVANSYAPAPWSRARASARDLAAASVGLAQGCPAGLLRPPDGTEPMARRPAGTPAIQDRSPSSGVASSALGGPGPGHEFVQTGGWPEIDQLGEDVGQIGLRLDAAELAGLNQRSDAGPILAP